MPERFGRSQHWPTIVSMVRQREESRQRWKEIDSASKKWNAHRPFEVVKMEPVDA